MKGLQEVVAGVGLLEVIAGPMFSGKTEELIRRVRRAQIARVKVQIFKPTIDNRYSASDVVSHSSQSIQAQTVNHSLEILSLIYDSTRVVAIDEVQFFDDKVVSVISKLIRRGLRVIVAGLDLDYRGVPFGVMPTLLALADDVTKVAAICTVCGALASKTQRIVDDTEQVIVGESNLYEARCRNHHDFVMNLEELLPHQKEIQHLEIFQRKS
jgi:thymidine kinase